MPLPPDWQHSSRWSRAAPRGNGPDTLHGLSDSLGVLEEYRDRELARTGSEPAAGVLRFTSQGEHSLGKAEVLWGIGCNPLQ
jgi:hypothetical protein